MAKQAKLQLIADVKTFKQSIQEARNILKGLGDTDISDKSIKKLKDAMENDLAQSAKKVQEEMNGVRAVMVKLGKTDIVDTNKVSEQVRKLGELKTKLNEIKQAQKELSSETPSGDVASTAGARRGGMAPQMLRKGLGAFGLGVGVAGSLMMGRRVSQEQSRIRALTGGTMAEQGIGLEYGYSEAESRQRQEMFSRSAGRDLTTDEISKATKTMMQAERAYGVDAETSSQAMTSARKAGVKDQTKFLGDTIGVAVASGLEGSRISEFLQASTAYLEQMSQGINIDAQSLNGFAGALSTIPFFAQDPNRAFSMMKSMDTMFQSGDPYQRTLASRGIISAAGGTGGSLGAIEFRRKMGLFGELDEETKGLLGGMQGGKGLLNTLGTKPEDIISNIFKDVQGNTKGMDIGNRLFAFQQATGMEAGASAALFARLETGKGISKEDIEKFKTAQMTPEERMEKTFTGTAKEIETFTSKLQDVVEQMSVDIAGPISNLGNLIPLNTQQLARVAEGLIILNTVMGTKLGGDLLGKGGELLTKGGGLGGIAKKAMSLGGRAMGAVGRIAGPAALAYSALSSESLGPQEGTPEWKLENGMPLTPEERASLQSFNPIRDTGPQGLDLLKRPESMGLPQMSDMFRPMSTREEYVTAPMSTPQASPDMNENTNALKDMTNVLKNLLNSGGGGFADRTRSPMRSGVKVGM